MKNVVWLSEAVLVSRVPSLDMCGMLRLSIHIVLRLS